MGWSFYAAAADRKSLEQVLPGFHNKTSPMAFRKGPPVQNTRLFGEIPLVKFASQWLNITIFGSLKPADIKNPAATVLK